MRRAKTKRELRLELRIARMNNSALHELWDRANARPSGSRIGEMCEEEYERRLDHEDREPVDWDEQDRRAAWEERYEMWRREY